MLEGENNDGHLPATDVTVRRKSIRKYLPEPLDEAQIQAIKDIIATLEPLFPQIKFAVEILSAEEFAGKLKQRLVVSAPAYLVLTSEIDKGCRVNIGYIGQKLILELAKMDIGSCWQGGAKCKSDDLFALPYIISISCGKTDELWRQVIEEFKRKPLDVLVEGGNIPQDLLPVMEAARIAPSGINLQPWRFIVEADRIHVFRRKAPLRLPMIDKMQQIDIGCVIANMMEVDSSLIFEVSPVPPKPPTHCIYEATLVKPGN